MDNTNDPTTDDVNVVARLQAIEDTVNQFSKELDKVVPHLVNALKRNDSATVLAEKLDDAEKRANAKTAMPVAAELAGLVGWLGGLELEPVIKTELMSRLDHALNVLGYQPYGADHVGQVYDPGLMDVVDGQGRYVEHVYAQGYACQNIVAYKSKVRLGEGETA